MEIDGLALPPLLLHLVEAGIWPRTHQDAKPALDKARVQAISRGNTAIDFASLESIRALSKIVEADQASDRTSNVPPERTFWRTYGTLEDIDPSLALCIGDYGLGSDSFIVLDYRASRTEPSVAGLGWEAFGPGQPPAGFYLYGPYRRRARWQTCAPTFDEFVERLALRTAKPRRY